MENFSFYSLDGEGVIYEISNDIFFTFDNGIKKEISKDRMKSAEPILSFKWFENLYPEIASQLFKILDL